MRWRWAIETPSKLRVVGDGHDPKRRLIQSRLEADGSRKPAKSTPLNQCGSGRSRSRSRFLDCRDGKGKRGTKLSRFSAAFVIGVWEEERRVRALTT
ncbi:hypothetical protein TIFTF001_004193 [Ficus carica]|uniref:Uncharacterized protein n=1 Tax=Ficus carica TaxID=3494 RepID=A0AA88CWS5_FICCA|nr:hypothetical protein TIFTF001_004193 [Ficus carica]